MNKKIIIATVLVLCAAAAAWYANRPAPADGDLVLYGNVDVRQVSLAFNGSERIASLAVQEGDQVRPGQVVGKLDTTTLELRIAESRAQANALEQTLARLRAGNRPQEVGQARAWPGRPRRAGAFGQLLHQRARRLRVVGRGFIGLHIIHPGQQAVEAGPALGRRQPAPLGGGPAEAHQAHRIALFLRHEAQGQHRLQRVVELTPAEAAVSRALAAGSSLEDIAAATGVSVNTVKTHLHRVYGKTSTRRQGELIALIHGSTATLLPPHPVG
eukprot:gene34092-42039_t